MLLIEQITQLLSQPPGTIIYHLVMLLALQAVFALAWGQWRRNRTDGLAMRMAWGAGAIWILRIMLLVVGLVVANNPTVSILPPLTQAIQGLTAVFLLWSLSLPSSRWPRPSDTLLGISVIFILVLTLFFAQSWRTLAAQGVLYEESQQALFWLLFQLIIYALGLLLSLFDTESQRSLRPFIFALFLTAKMIQLALPPTVELFIWQRLADFIAFPLWAALVYRHVLVPLLLTEAATESAANRSSELLQQATRVAIASFDTENAIREAIRLMQGQVDLSFVAIALVDEDGLLVTSNRPQRHEDRPQSWRLALSHWPALRTAVDNHQRIELQPNGLGARQLHQLYEEFGLPTATLAPMIIEPLTEGDQLSGLLLIANPTGWPDDDLRLISDLAKYVAQILANGRRHQQTIDQALSTAITAVEVAPPPIGTGRIIALESENKRLQEEMQLAQDRLYQEEQHTALAQQRARDLAATIEESQRNNRDDEMRTVQAEIETLRESLIQAEEAVAMASAADSGLSTEWVMRAITRYSGELEEAQARIEDLEMELRNRSDNSPRYEMIASLVEELRTPLTSIAGYTDLMLSESAGRVTEKQRNFLQRVRANAERLGTLLEQVIQLATRGEVTPVVSDKEALDAREVIESAVHAVITRMQDKNLRLDMDIPENLEPLVINREALQQILINLLNNACQSSPRNGRVFISARTETLPFDTSKTAVRFMRIAVTDSGRGIKADDLNRVFDPHLQSADPLIEGIGDTAAGLAVARTLTQTYGGRIWLNSEVGEGSTFCLVFPLMSKNGIAG